MNKNINKFSLKIKEDIEFYLSFFKKVVDQVSIIICDIEIDLKKKVFNKKSK
tara:strand:- start:1954 stop:2109 length:156 start_codon:yes stop_codon:yes gene_type:complete